jgi:1-acyl-sn-glycerol-3-phosphate acyltransferase
MKRVWLNLQFYPVFFLFSLVAIPALALFVAAQAPFVGHRRAMRRFRRAISWYGWVIIHVLPLPLVRFRYEDTGGELPVGGALVVCNHRSSSDPFMMACLPRECVQIVNAWPFRLPVLGFFARCAGYLNVNKMPVEAFYARAGRLLEEGVWLIAFPEGTRARGREVGSFHSSVFRLALERRTPIVPLCIVGTERIPPRGTGWLNPGVIRVRRLPTVSPDEFREWSAFQLKTRVRDRIAAAVAAMEGAA